MNILIIVNNFKNYKNKIMNNELKNYKLSSLQIHTIEILYSKFKNNLESINKLCKNDKIKPIGIGFELGKMYTIIEQDYYEAMALIETINEQN